MSNTATVHHTFFGKLIASIGGFFEKLLGKAEDGFNSLPEATQQDIIKGTNISEIIKSGYAKGETFVVSQVAGFTGLPSDQAETLIIGTLKDMGINAVTVDGGLKQLADKVQAGITDVNWNGLWQLAAKSAAILISGGSINWLTVSLGAIEWAYQNYIAKSK